MRQERLTKDFFLQPTLKISQDLLGKFLNRKIGSKTISGKIVETEAYIGPKDKAAHSFGGKVTKRNKIEYSEGGFCYIYLVYGMYWQFNITTGKQGKPECVLIRALEPVIKNKELKNITNGPGKLCRWLKINKTFYGEDMIKSKRLWIEDRGVKIEKSQLMKAKRIGIDYAEEWKEKLWRFYLKENEFVSRK